jgi:23S rRNA pseudouridine1911/1915/1917 synthase
MASIGHPLVGDPLYAGHRKGLAFPRQALHAKRLGLLHPVSGEAMQWQCPLPEDMKQLLRDLREQRAEMRNQAEEDEEEDYDVACYYVGDGDFDDDDE